MPEETKPEEVKTAAIEIKPEDIKLTYETKETPETKEVKPEIKLEKSVEQPEQPSLPFKVKEIFEEILTPPDLDIPTQHEFLNPSVHSDVGSALVQLVSLNNDNVLHEPTCVICSSPQREDIEKKWLDTKSYKEVKLYFKTFSDYRLSNNIIENHMLRHLDKGISETVKAEYISKIQRMNNVELTTLDRIRFGLSAIDERIVGINSIVPNTEISAVEIEKIKSDSLAKLVASYNQLLKLKSTIMGEMVNQGDLIIIPKQSFIEIFNRAIAESKSEDEKNSILQLLTNLQELNRKTQ